MDFYEVLDHILALLRSRGRVSYRAIKQQFHVDDDVIEALKDELIYAQQVADDEQGRVLVWKGQPEQQGRPVSQEAPLQRPIAYTPRHLAERIRAEQAALEARGAPDGERKTITALFADIKGSMDLLEDLDPDDARRIIDQALTRMMDAVHRYEGYVAQSLGDGIFALFGAPIAHEDHPHRALYAALRMQEEIRRYAETLRRERGVNLEIRVGINTGEVVLRSIRTDDLHTDYVPIGHSTSLAARMESLASGGAIVVSDHTYRLTEGYFEFRSLGAAQVKGVSEPLHIYEVLGVGPLRTRLQVAARRGLVRFIGRQGELAQMQKALERARAGQGQIVAVVGEPGVGKSRLCYEFKLLSQRDCLVLETFSVSHGKAYPYLPLIELLKGYFQITPQDDERHRREKMTGKVLTLDRSLEDTLPYLWALLGDVEATASLRQMDPQIKRRRSFDALKRLLVRESLNQPLLLIVEDLHWLDSESEAFLNVLSESVATAPLLVLVNYRPEYHHTWGNKAFYSQVRLDPLGPAEAQELLTVLLGDGASMLDLKQLILARTQGNPFFIEEIVQSLLDQGVLVRDPTGGTTLSLPSPAKSMTELHLPPTVQGVLAARVDRLPTEEKALLQTLAVIGKQFSLSLLTRVVGQPEEELHGCLGRLQAAEFIYEQPAFPEPEYTFKHALTQDVAYNSLPGERRRMLHERTAQAIEGLFGDRLEEQYGELAHHYRRSGNTPKAIEYLQRAGQQAVERSAYAEAIEHLSMALELLNTLPETAERNQHELVVQTTLGPALMVTRGIAAPEVEPVYARARELAQQVGDTPQLFPVLAGLGSFYRVHGRPQRAREVEEQCFSLAQRQRDPALLLHAHVGMGVTLLWLGEITSARAHLEQAMALEEPQRRRTLGFGGGLGGIDPKVGGGAFLAVDLSLLGYADQALRRSQEALALARERPHPYSLATALFYAAWCHLLRREGQAAQAPAEAAITLCTAQGFPYFAASATLIRGWALADQGASVEGIAQMRQGLAAHRAMGAELARPHWLALLAEAHGKAGQVEAGLSLVAEALALVEEHGECWGEAELHRLKGELLLTQAGKRHRAKGTRQKWEEAEGCFQQALDIARRQQAKSLELRAALSLSRLWQGQGERDAARQLLAPIYGWFTEGFDTADLREAKALLQELM